MAHRGELFKISSDKLVSMFEASNVQVTKLASLIEDLLDVTRITFDRMDLHTGKFNASDMINDVINDNQVNLFNAKCEVVVRSDKNLIVNLDKSTMEQVLTNLLMNATKYAHGKSVEILLEQLDQEWGRLVVRDEGPGIASADKERFFNRFERVDDRDNIGGLGLGLYITRQILEAHGGKIFVESEIGKCSSFIVDFPLDLAA